MICELCYKPAPPNIDETEWRRAEGSPAVCCPECFMRVLSTGMNLDDCTTGMFSYGVDPRLALDGQPEPAEPPPQQQAAPPIELLRKAAIAEAACEAMATSLVNEFLFQEQRQGSPEVRAQLRLVFLQDAMRNGELKVDNAIRSAQEALTPEAVQDLKHWGQIAR